jgi:hypothetical protein
MNSCVELTNDWCPTDQVLILPGAELTYQVGAELNPPPPQE